MYYLELHNYIANRFADIEAWGKAQINFEGGRAYTDKELLAVWELLVSGEGADKSKEIWAEYLDAACECQKNIIDNFTSEYTQHKPKVSETKCYLRVRPYRSF